MQPHKQILDEIAQLVENEIKFQLSQPRPSRTYDGRTKPTNPKSANKYGVPLSPPKTREATLYNETKAYWETDLEDGNANLVVDFGKATYWKFVEYGRRPNKSNSGGLKDGIKRWMYIKPIPRFRDDKGRFITDEKMSFLLTRSVARDGYYKTEFIQKAMIRVIREVETRMGDAVAQWVLDLIDSGRLIKRPYQSYDPRKEK